MATITRDGTTIAPTLVQGYTASSDSRTIKHTLLDGTVVYHLQKAGPRTGALSLFFATYAAAWAAFELHRGAGVFDYDDSEIPAASMLYVTTGAVQIALDPETLIRWTVTVPYLEVVP